VAHNKTKFSLKQSSFKHNNIGALEIDAHVMLCLLITPKFINEFNQKGEENTFFKRTLAYMGNTLLDNGLKYINNILSQMFDINTDDVS